MKNLKIFFLIFATISLLTSCEELENHGLTANAGPDQEASVGVPVTLSSEASIDSNGDGYLIVWNLESLPAGSAASISNPGSEIVSFTPDVEGLYEVRLTISNNLGESSDLVTISAIASGSVEIGGTYNEALHLTNIVDDPDVPDYIVTSDITMNAELSVDEGVRIGVGSDRRITIGSSGVIKAMGTEQQPIIISGTTELPGFWRGIRISSNNLENELNYVHISSTGSNIISSGRQKTALHLENARLFINNCVIANNDGYGITSHVIDDRMVMTNNHLHDNNAGAMFITASQINDIDSNTDFGGQEIFVTGNNVNTGNSHIWIAPLNSNYHFTNNLDIYDEVSIEAGTELVFDNEVRMYFRNNSIIKVLGTESNPVVFRGSLEVPGSWRGVLIESSNLENTIQYARFNHAGHSDLASGYEKAAIGLASTARVEIMNSEFNEIDGYGIYTRWDGATLSFANNTFLENISQGALKINAVQISALDEASDFGGHIVEVDGGDLAVEQDVTWPALNNGKYFFTSNSQVRGKITIQPGANLTFDNDIRLYITGVIVAQGNASQPIVFTRAENSNAYWRGILLDSSSLENVLDFVEISYGGNSNLSSGYQQANLGLSSSSKLTLSNSTISNSLGYGVYMRNGADLNESNNSFSNNTLNDIFTQ
jgi:hypothetical protein